MSKHTYSAPGKALLAGGYLVLFSQYEAVSIALSSRVHVDVFSREGPTLEIRSPQFLDSVWTFPPVSGNANPFLSACVDTVKAYFGFQPKGTLEIWSDDGFHSQQNSVSGPNPQFRYHKAPITAVPKTGLGSSAALVVAVVAGLCDLACGETKTNNLTQMQLHNLAQIAHCIAQGKLGSGFDVATAVFGSICYSRPPAECVPLELDSEAVKSAVNAKWDMVCEPFKLPASVRVVMGDVKQGSNTPGMVRKVLDWHKSSAEGEAVFAALNKANMGLASELKSAEFRPAKISAALSEVRQRTRELTNKSEVPVEPPSQTQLLNRASEVKGVLGGVVPGAGGFDAVCLLADISQRPLPEILADLNSIENVEWIPLGVETEGLKKTT